MEITRSEFVSSFADVRKCPAPTLPEFAFIGRSNVGKSSLINMLAKRKNLAKISNRPGKTQTINHFIINEAWYLVDLPGYGYAGVSRTLREGWGKMIEQYILKRENLYCLFILLDCRHEPQKIDLDFIQWSGENEIPIALILTKADKLTKSQALQNKKRFEKKLSDFWSELPPIFTTSATEKTGRNELLSFIEQAITKQL